ncbi:hypothetical protein ACTMU2_35900 (plasmid) [Cupriavidus basilensis]|jgi:hypothetical protein|uniref:hypothetical protein n=1 Tax=unclassified Cupriavidus TaxID=2640874 RepID=UPI0010F62E4B|nr:MULTISPECIES: hypothetical protein [unclassified Cupriavidus]MWL91975.1 hypothetical protein [Cupriavidus sp. SW-Y-13]
MGRNYILERTIADPRTRAVHKTARKRAKVKRLQSERAATAAYLDRARWCANGCGKPVATGENGWTPCCSEACHGQWVAVVAAHFDSQQARRARRTV